MMHQAYKFASEVQANGKVEVTLPLPPGTPVEVVILAPDTDEFEGLREAAQQTMGFWDNPDDDAEWNDA